MSSKNIILEGATYNGVESITLPTSGGGSATFNEVSDTTAIAEDVASGKFFYNALGVLTEGTASGGGGLTNVVIGDVNSGSKKQYFGTRIDYNGNGYLVAFMIYVKGGAYRSGSTWYSKIQRYAVGQWTMSKSDTTTAPTFATSGDENIGVVTCIYKNSTSNADSYTITSNMHKNVFTTTNPSQSALDVVKIKLVNNSTYFYMYATNSGYGFPLTTNFTYIAVFSE